MPDNVFTGNVRQCFFRECWTLFYFYGNIRLFLQGMSDGFYRECQTVLQGMPDTVFTGNVRDSASAGNVTDSVLMGNI